VKGFRQRGSVAMAATSPGEFDEKEVPEGFWGGAPEKGSRGGRLLELVG